MYKSMNHDEINIIYKVDNNDNEIKIFGHDFVERNRNKCNIIYEDKEEELKEYMKVNTSWFSKKINKLKIKLKGIINISNMSCMFKGCSSLTSLPDISKWNTYYVTNMSFMFCECFHHYHIYQMSPNGILLMSLI